MPIFRLNAKISKNWLSNRIFNFIWKAYPESFPESDLWKVLESSFQIFQFFLFFGKRKAGKDFQISWKILVWALNKRQNFTTQIFSKNLKNYTCFVHGPFFAQFSIVSHLFNGNAYKNYFVVDKCRFYQKQD